MERILISGGGGYIGSRLVPELLRQKYKVTVLDNFMYGQNSLLDCCDNKNFEVIRGDCRDEKILEKAMDGMDIIIPLAAIVGFPAADADTTATISTNLEAIKTILKFRDKKQKILMPNTNSGYGIGQKDKFCTEETPLNPVSLYGRTKCESERNILESGNAISFRLATVFGASNRMRTDLLVNDFVYRAINDSAVVVFGGHATRNYIHILDVVDTFIYGIRNWESMKDNVYNVGLSSANLSKLELCEKIKKHLPKFVYMEAEIGEDPDKRDYLISNAKLENKGWCARRSIDDGIKELIKVYQIIKNNKYGNV